jgi:hypothetical protein
LYSGKSDNKLESANLSREERQRSSLTMGSSGLGMSDNSATLSEGSKNISLGSSVPQSEQVSERTLTPGEALKQHVMDSGPQLDKPESMPQQSDSVERRDSIDESQVERPKEGATIESNPQDSVERRDSIDESQVERPKEGATIDSSPQNSVERRDSIDESQVEKPKEGATIESSPKDPVVSKVDNIDSSQSESEVSKAPDIVERKTSTKLHGGE